jgi:hypothetical protein
VQTTTIQLSGVVAFAQPLTPSRESVELPERVIEPKERVYRITSDFQDMRAGDLLIVDPRVRIQTGERVLATFQGNVYFGNWWKKHGKTELVVDPTLKHMSKVEPIGVINCIVRNE